jgi:hypothetical protein
MELPLRLLFRPRLSTQSMDSQYNVNKSLPLADTMRILMVIVLFTQFKLNLILTRDMDSNVMPYKIISLDPTWITQFQQEITTSMCQKLW